MPKSLMLVKSSASNILKRWGPGDISKPSLSVLTL